MKKDIASAIAVVVCTILIGIIIALCMLLAMFKKENNDVNRDGKVNMNDVIAVITGGE